jgi:cell fate regulator YaaT (PSP1 superfamily)
MRRVIRRVGPEDLLLMRRNKKREEEAFDICQKRIAERKLPMKLIQVAYLHGGNKAIFYFSAEGRVDFRALVRDLAQQLHVRIEMRQIGVRDESKMLGGVGICGQQLCCARFLRKFVPVSIKMAKNQNLALNPQKLSGLCGRLMCCLVFEDDLYKKLKKDLPKVGSTIETPRGEGKVLNTDILGRRIQVQLEQTTCEFTIEELRGEKAPQPRKPLEPEQAGAYSERKAEGDKAREGRRRKRRSKNGQKRPAPQAGPKADKPKDQPKKSEAPGEAQAQDPAGKKRRKRRSRRRSRRRKKKAPGDGGQAAGPDRESAG